MTNVYSDINEAMNAFGLAFEVEKVPLFINKGGLKRVENTVATVRTDTRDILGIVGHKYEVVQNSEQFGVFQEFADKKIISFENGGVFEGGSRTYIQAVLPECIDINPDRGDIIKKMVTICSSHDGTLALQAFVTPIRIICTNTFQVAIDSGQHKTKIKHTKTANLKLVQAIETIQNALNMYGHFDEFILNSTKTKEFSEKETQKFVELLLPSTAKEVSTRTRNQRSELLETIFSGIGQAEIQKNNLYKLFNGVTSWTNNILPQKGKGNKNPLEFVTFASGNSINMRAFDISKKILKNELVLN